MDQFSVSVSSFVSSLEDLRLPYIGAGNCVKAVVIGVPIAVLIHDLADHWMPSKLQLPIISWFTRKWRADPDTKLAHLRVIRNLLMFAFFVILQNDITGDEVSVLQPSDLVEQRVHSTSATRAMSNEISKARRAAFSAADEVIGEEELNGAAVQQQADSVLRRRRLHDKRLQN